jgi:hypothetical protein
MSTTPEVFSQDLHNAFSEVATGGSMSFVVNHGAAAMNILLTPAPDRVIALMRLPTLLIRIDFTAGSAVERKEMLKRMDLYMQRGGG